MIGSKNVDTLSLLTRITCTVIPHFRTFCSGAIIVERIVEVEELVINVDILNTASEVSRRNSFIQRGWKHSAKH